MNRTAKTVLKNSILGGALLIMGGLAAFFSVRVSAHFSPENAAAIAENVALLEEEASRQIAGMAFSGPRVYVTDLAAEERKILDLQDVDGGALVRRFENAAIMGDSVIQAIEEYGVLDNSKVFAQIGQTIGNTDDMIRRMTAVQPATVFLCFGLNDIHLYRDDVDRFVKDYAACVETLREQLPFSEICICAVPPMSDRIAATTPAYAYRDDYNEALEALCRKEGLIFADGAFILEDDPSLYDQDGVHPKRSFYPRWLTFLADMAGVPDAK